MQTIYIDIANKSVLPTIYAKQGEVGRKFEVVLTDSGVPYNVESGVLFSVWYEGASGEGNYTDIGENPAFTISGNRAVVELITQMLVNPGCGTVCLVMNKGANQIGVWNIPYICEQVPGFDSEEAKDYYTAFSNAVEKVPYPDPTLSTVGAPAEAKATGDALAKRAFAERTVNGYPLTEDINLNAADISAAPVDHLEDTNNPHNVTAEQTGARPNTWMPTPEEIGAAPSVASADHPGCYYRMVDGEEEWVNPPMCLGVEYRTTWRHNDKAVYTKLIDCGTIPASGRTVVSHNLGCRIIRMEGSTSNGGTMPYRDPTVNGYIDLGSSSNNLVITTSLAGGTSPGTGTVQLWYVKA